MLGKLIVRLMLLSSILALLSGCVATSVSSQKQDADKLADTNQGYLLIGLVNDYDLQALYVWGEENFKLTHADLSAGENYILLPVKAGEYHFGRIDYNYYYRTKLNEDEWRFEVKPGRINYVGHLTVEQPFYFFFANHIELENRAANAQMFMEAHFPGLLTSREMFYAGPGQDRFYDLIAELENPQ
jgi:hypothetical protein